MAEAIDIDELVAEFGAYLEKNGQNVNSLKSKIMQPLETDALFTVGVTDSEVVKMAITETTRVTQPFQQTYTPLGNMSFKPRKIELQRIKIDLLLNPDAIVHSFAGFLANLNDLERANWTITKYFAEKMILEQHQKDLELYEVFPGEYAAPAAGTPGAVGTALNGIRKLIRDDNSAGLSTLIVPLSGSLITSDDKDVCTYIESFVDGIDPLVRMEGGEIVVAPEILIRYKRGKRAKYNTNYLQESELTTVTDYPQFTVVGKASHTGSKMIWFSPKWNKFLYKIAPQLSTFFKVESAKRQVAIYTDYFRGYGFADPQYLYHNDQDLA